MLPILLSLLVQPILCANDTQVECDHIWKADDKCSFAGEYCQDYAGTLFNYISLFYCTNSVLYKILLVVFYAILLFTLFLFISTSAGDFFCPNLHTIAGIFGMSENLTGVTFLAFGSGAPDLFSTFNALQQGSNSLAIGELLGAASFITTVVVGSIALRGFRANRRPFVRDILFFVAAVSLIIGVLWDGKLTLVESLLLICLYVLYVIVVVFSRWIHVRSMKISQANGHTEDNDLIEQADTLFQPNQDFEDQDPLLGNHLSKEEHEMLLNKHRFTSASSKMWYFRQKRHGHHRFKEGLSESFNLKPRLSMDSEATSNTMSSQQAKSPESAQLVDSESSIKSNKETNQDETSGIDDSNLPSADISEIPGSLLRRRTRLNSLINEQYLAERFKRLWMARPTAKQIILSLFPILEEWEDQTWIQRLISLGSIPAYVLLTLTIPVVDLEEEDDEEILRIAEDGVSFYTPSDKESWNWWFLLAQSIVSPLFFCTGFGLWNSTACVPFILTSFILPVVVAAFINPFKKPKYYKVIKLQMSFNLFSFLPLLDSLWQFSGFQPWQVKFYHYCNRLELSLLFQMPS